MNLKHKYILTQNAEDFAKFTKNCSSTFVCANAISIAYDTKNWASLI